MEWSSAGQPDYEQSHQAYRQNGGDLRRRSGRGVPWRGDGGCRREMVLVVSGRKRLGERQGFLCIAGMGAVIEGHS